MNMSRGGSVWQDMRGVVNKRLSLRIESSVEGVVWIFYCFRLCEVVSGLKTR